MLRKLHVLVLFLLLNVLLSGAVMASEVIRVALLPIPDVLPAYVAKELGLFEKGGLKVEMLPVGSGLERDQLMQAGQVDGMLNELISTANFNRKEIKVQVVAISRKPAGSVPLFRLLASPESGINGCEDLLGKSVVISKNTIIDYITEKLLLQCGVAVKAQETISVASLPERYQLLLSSQIDVATLPEPLATSAILAGAKDVADDTTLADQSLSVLSFSVDSIENKREEVAIFVNAWNLAVLAINANPDKFRKVMLENIRVPGNVRDIYQIPHYAEGQLPNKDIWSDTMNWMISRGLLEKPLSFQDSISNDFVGQ
ncbi:MAG: ABC transporter substrate-binding protein [Desulfotalea sp.]